MGQLRLVLLILALLFFGLAAVVQQGPVGISTPRLLGAGLFCLTLAELVGGR